MRVSSREIIQRLKQDGWYEVAHVGSHKQFKHPTKPGRVYGATPEPRYTNRHFAQHRKAGGHQAEVSMEYIAYLHKEPKSDFGVSFPDFPGCVTAGRTLEEARRKASEALSLHIAGMIEDGEKIPKPSNVDDIADDPALKDAVAFLVHASARVEKTVRINITARESQIEEINTLARAAGLTRSAYMVQAAFSAIPKVGRANTVKNYHAKLKAKMSETKALRKAGLKKRAIVWSK